MALDSTEIYDPAAHTTSAGPALHTGRYAHSATLLIDGTVLLAGGNNGTADLSSVEVFDPVAGTIAVSSASMATPRSGHIALLLPSNDQAMLIGGTSSGADLSSTELYRSWTATIFANPALATPRSAAAGSPLQGQGAVVVTGGSNLSSTELYGFATVKTDKLDYAPGTPVQITGSGWQPGETVTLSLVESPDLDEHPAMTAIADSLGNISNSDFAPDLHDLDIRFFLTAAGSKSQAQTTFTDGNTDTSITVTTSPTAWLLNQPVTFNATVLSAASGKPVGEGCIRLLLTDMTTVLATGTNNQFSISRA